MTITEQTVLAEIFYFGQVFVFGRLVNKNVLEWFLSIICKEDTQGRFTNLVGRNHPTCFWARRDQQMPITYCVCLKRMTLCNCMFSSTPSSRFSLLAVSGTVGIVSQYSQFWKSLKMAVRGGEFSFFQSIHVSTDKRIDISIFVRSITTKSLWLPKSYNSKDTNKAGAGNVIISDYMTN